MQRHVRANSKLWNVIEARMNELLPAALNIVGDVLIPASANECPRRALAFRPHRHIMRSAILILDP